MSTEILFGFIGSIVGGLLTLCWHLIVDKTKSIDKITDKLQTSIDVLGKEQKEYLSQKISEIYNKIDGLVDKETCNNHREGCEKLRKEQISNLKSKI